MTHLNYLRQAIDPSACIDQAWELVKRRIWLYIGASLVIAIAPQFIPYIGFLLTAPLMGGFAYIVLKDSNDEAVDFGMLFKGFEKILPLLAVALVQAVPVFGIAAVVGVAAATGSLPTMNSSSGTGVFTPVVTVGLVMWVVGYFAFAVIWGWAMTFVIPLIIEHGVGFGDAIKLSFGAAFGNTGRLFVLGLWGALVGLLGILALFVGIFVALPVIQAASVLAYKQVFPRVTIPPDMPPPAESIYD